MIQVNLLPDVKQEYLRTEQLKHAVLVGAVLTSVTVVALTILFFVYVQVVQPQYQRAVQSDIDTGLQEVKKKPNAKRIVTVQGVLEQIPAVKDKQLVTSRSFEYLKQFTPRSVKYSRVNLNHETSTMTLSGNTVSYESANVLANNLKSAQFTYKQQENEQTIKPFTGVVFTNLGKSEDSTNGSVVSFEITFQFDPLLFNPSVSKQSIKVNASSEQLLLPEETPFDEQATGGVQ